MKAFLAQLLLTSMILAAPTTVAVFVGSSRRPPLGATARAGVAGGLTAGAALALGALLGAGPLRSAAVAAFLLLGVLACARVAAGWTMRGLLVWVLTITAGASYLGYVAEWTLTEPLSLASRLGGGVLWSLELFVFVLALGYVWEVVDVLARWDWRRSIAMDRLAHEPLADEHAGAEDAAPARPFVSLHVPTHNEPADLVIATLESLLALDYPDFEILVLDNNTTDPALWRPVEAFCADHGRVRFFHLDDWPGYKSGALNFGLGETDPRAEVIGVVDADYLVRPDFLSRCAPLFADPELAFVQTPQDYRAWEGAPYFRRLYYSYSYFFDVSQRSRNERNGAIFGGTMGLIRREALSAVGGWDEWCITEDAELSLRLLKAGWSGTHIGESFGVGIMPLTFEALKRQRFRWCFGGVQILRMHARDLLPGRRTADNRLTLGQRWAYLVGGLQWFGDLAGLLFTAFLLIGAVNAFVGAGFTLRTFSGPLLVGVIGLLGLGWGRSIALLRRTGRPTWGEAIGAFGLWAALGWAVALGSVRGLVAREGVFLRTPKTRGDLSARDALRGNLVEVCIALVCAAGAALGLAAWVRDGSPGGLVVAVLLLVQGLGHAAAPLNSLAAIAADLTPELRRRRRNTLRSWTRVTPGIRRWGLGPALAAGSAAALLLLLAAPVGGPVLDELPRTAVPRPKSEPTLGPRPTPTSVGPTSPGSSLYQAVPASGPAPNGVASSTVPSARPTVAPTTAGPTSAPTSRATVAPTQASQSPRPSSPATSPTRAAQPTGRPTATPTPTSHPTRP